MVQIFQEPPDLICFKFPACVSFDPTASMPRAVTVLSTCWAVPVVLDGLFLCLLFCHWLNLLFFLVFIVILALSPPFSKDGCLDWSPKAVGLELTLWLVRALCVPSLHVVILLFCVTLQVMLFASEHKEKPNIYLCNDSCLTAKEKPRQFYKLSVNFFWFFL